ncbi:MAG: hypothetical protein FJW31_28580 [Acidobacteria bacterium]|nr:hypothetical protein [Acidobacteriota bacterium]
MYLRDATPMREAFPLVPEYLRTAEHPAAVNLKDYSFQLGRRFRALKLWFVMRAYGRRGMTETIEAHCEMACEFARRLEADGRFLIAAPVEFSLVCFRLLDGSDDDNRDLLDAINSTGEAFLSHASVGGRVALRMAVGNWQTTPADMARMAALVMKLV